MKVIQINVVYGFGSTGKIVKDIHHELIKQNIESLVIYGGGNKTEEQNLYKVSEEIRGKINKLFSILNGLEYDKGFFSTKKTINIIKKNKPDIVHIHCINGYVFNIFKILEYLKEKKINTVVTHHSEFYYSGNYSLIPDESHQWIKGEKEKLIPNYKSVEHIFRNRNLLSFKKMKKSFSNFENLAITSVSPWVDKRSKKSIILRNAKHYIVENGIDNKIFYPRSTTKLKDRHGLTNEKIILHVTSGFNNPVKGSQYIIKLAQRLSSYNIKILIIGIQDNVDLPENCINIGVIKNQDLLAEYYSLADLSVITSVKETFSMIVAESLSCGTPIVGFKAGGPETITINEFSSFVDYGDIIKLEQEVLNIIHLKTPDLSKKISQDAQDKYTKDKMIKKYISVYEDMISTKIKKLEKKD